MGAGLTSPVYQIISDAHAKLVSRLETGMTSHLHDIQFTQSVLGDDSLQHTTNRIIIKRYQ